MDTKSWAFIVLLSAAAVSVGCGGSHSPAPAADAAHADHNHADPSGHSLGGWWCDEHGVPEEVCARCDSRLVADFKAKGDWCEKHNRPDSHCFLCHPEKEAEFAALYEAKAGKKPPKPTENGI